MSREVDRRRPIGEVDEQRLDALARDVSDRLPGAQTAQVATLDAMTGNAGRVESAGAPAEPGSYPARALEHLRSVAPLLGLGPVQPAEFVPDPVVQVTSSGAHTVHLRQQHQGIPVFQAARAVTFDPAGAVSATTGSSVTIDQPLTVAPQVRVEDAVLAAAAHVARPTSDERGGYDQFNQPFNPPEVDPESFQPRVTAVLPGSPDRATVLEPGPFAEAITAGLVWFALSPGDIRLGWRVTLTMPGHVQRFVVVVDAGEGAVLYAHQTVLAATAVGDVYLVDGGRARQRIDFPRALSDYRIGSPPGLPVTFPDAWVLPGRDDTAGANVVARTGDTGPVARGRREGDRLTFDPDPDSGDQLVVNAFALASSAHDFFYLLGFTEAEGNFQADSLGRGGTATDPVDARVYADAVPGTASMVTPVDGTSPVLRLGVVARTRRHTALDATIVFHEFAHGVTNRLVGGGLDGHALDEPQSAGMGEGWSDFFACVHARTTVVAAWAVGKPWGIRDHAYDENHPGSFAKLGTPGFVEVHEVGEVWCATLMEMTRRLGSEELALRLVVDALKLSPANPSFLDGRDAILAALTDMRDSGRLPVPAADAARVAVWGAFAKFGMGPAARSVGARLAGIRGDTTVPAVPAPSSGAPMYMVTVLLDAGNAVRQSRVVRLGDGTPGGSQQAPEPEDGGRRVQYFVETDGVTAAPQPAPADLRLVIDDLRFEMTDRPERLLATIDFGVTGADHGARYIAHVVVTGEQIDPPRVVATATGQLPPGGAGTAVALAFDTPGLGDYQLLGGVIVAPGEVIGVESGPLLHVVP